MEKDRDCNRTSSIQVYIFHEILSLKNDVESSFLVLDAKLNIIKINIKYVCN